MGEDTRFLIQIKDLGEIGRGVPLCTHTFWTEIVETFHKLKGRRKPAPFLMKNITTLNNHEIHLTKKKPRVNLKYGRKHEMYISTKCIPDERLAC